MIRMEVKGDDVFTEFDVSDAVEVCNELVAGIGALMADFQLAALKEGNEKHVVYSAFNEIIGQIIANNISLVENLLLEEQNSCN